VTRLLLGVRAESFLFAAGLWSLSGLVLEVNTCMRALRKYGYLTLDWILLALAHTND